MIRPMKEMDERQEAFVRRRFKQEVRRRMRAIRKGLPKDARAERSARIAERAAALPELEAPRVVAGFVSIKGEVDPAPLLDVLRERGAAVVLPRVDFELGAIVLHHHAPGDRLEESGFGVPEPLPSAPRADLAAVDLALVPALAIDPAGARIGYGKGFYDQLLPTLPNAFRLALAYDFQLVSEIPAEPHDQPIHALVTDTRLLRVDATG
ncbi:MAG: 5-formyltetrahydrofolate cyclo-ligase [Sandaracinus sp.]|nr:5-formyltetrahydrofolate cyclo-ligase [Myxococcales bacterium]MAC26800.1 5-formyltetrahydrofolate cyclo-ligase [Myxococcales bacterium]MAT24384.1 5-formyltetrahydrofolate cyclo-ligase [Sandaracinus sp.]MBJ70303.1 5-formyltetrahydrofolate cyclo-ligase [Sandaracinus sp.]